MASRRDGKKFTDEENIEWDLTEFAIEDSMVKRRFVCDSGQALRSLRLLTPLKRHRALAELKERFEASCVRPQVDTDCKEAGK